MIPDQAVQGRQPWGEAAVRCRAVRALRHSVPAGLVVSRTGIALCTRPPSLPRARVKRCKRRRTDPCTGHCLRHFRLYASQRSSLAHECMTPGAGRAASVPQAIAQCTENATSGEKSSQILAASLMRPADLARETTDASHRPRRQRFRHCSHRKRVSPPHPLRLDSAQHKTACNLAKIRTTDECNIAETIHPIFGMSGAQKIVAFHSNRLDSAAKSSVDSSRQLATPNHECRPHRSRRGARRARCLQQQPFRLPAAVRFALSIHSPRCPSFWGKNAAHATEIAGRGTGAAFRPRLPAVMRRRSLQAFQPPFPPGDIPLIPLK